jgi:hypothetical protein
MSPWPLYHPSNSILKTTFDPNGKKKSKTNNPTKDRFGLKLKSALFFPVHLLPIFRIL